jgi:hypothetical protein
MQRSEPSTSCALPVGAELGKHFFVYRRSQAVIRRGTYNKRRRNYHGPNFRGLPIQPWLRECANSYATHLRSFEQIYPASPFSSHIGTNYLPTSDEAIQIMGYIADKATRIAEVDQEIEDLKALRAKLTLEIEDHRSLLSPVPHLPIDILQEIFASCLPTEHYPVVSRYEAPLLLTQVCKNWRNIALSTPHLWSAIHIPIPSLPGHITSYEPPVGGLSDYLTALLALIHERMVAIHQWLERSKGSPLSISIFDAGNCPREVCDLVLDTIIHFAPRWNRLIFDTHSCDLNRIACLVPSQVPQLKSLVVRNEAVTENFEITYSIPVSWSASEVVKAPQLQEIALHQMTDNIIEFPLRWSQMTRIFLGSIAGARMFSTPTMSLKQVVFVLRSCEQLVSFRLEVLLLAEDLDQNQQPICLPSLQEFSFHDSGIDISSLFSLLELPSLKYLEFNTNAQHLKQSPLEMLLPRITTLERFITEPQFFARGHYTKCLSHMSSLTAIAIRWTPFFRSPDWSPMIDDNDNDYKIVSDALLAWFTTPDTAGDYPVPALETFECYATSEFTDKGVVDFIRKKYALPGIRALRKICIAFSGPQTADIIKEIGEEVSKQLDHALKYPYPTASFESPVVFHPFDGINAYPLSF